MTAVGYISDTEEIVKALWSHCKQDGLAAFNLSERSPLPPALAAQNVPGGQTQVLNVSHNRKIDRHSAKSDEDSAPESFSDTKNWPDWNGDLDNPNESEDHWEADNESDIELENGIKDVESPERRDVSAALNVPGLIWPTGRSKKKTEKVLMTVNTMETRKIQGDKTKLGRMLQCIFTRFFKLFE